MKLYSKRIFFSGRPLIQMLEKSLAGKGNWLPTVSTVIQDKEESKQRIMHKSARCKKGISSPRKLHTAFQGEQRQ